MFIFHTVQYIFVYDIQTSLGMPAKTNSGLALLTRPRHWSLYLHCRKFIPWLVEVFVSLGVTKSNSWASKVAVGSDEILLDPVPGPRVSSPGSRVDPVVVLCVLLHVSFRFQVVNVFKPVKFIFSICSYLLYICSLCMGISILQTTEIFLIESPVL